MSETYLSACCQTSLRSGKEYCTDRDSRLLLRIINKRDISGTVSVSVFRIKIRSTGSEKFRLAIHNVAVSACAGLVILPLWFTCCAVLLSYCCGSLTVLSCYLTAVVHWLCCLVILLPWFTDCAVLLSYCCGSLTVLSCYFTAVVHLLCCLVILLLWFTDCAVLLSYCRGSLTVLSCYLTAVVH
jgi:hypothetical protein